MVYFTATDSVKRFHNHYLVLKQFVKTEYVECWQVIMLNMQTLQLLLMLAAYAFILMAEKIKMLYDIH